MLYIITFTISLGISTLAMPLLKLIASRYGIMLDVPGERKLHARSIPRNGGLGIALASFIAIIIGLAANRGTQREEVFRLMGMLFGGASILILGVIDDIKGLNAYAKFSNLILHGFCMLLGFVALAAAWVDNEVAIVIIVFAGMILVAALILLCEYAKRRNIMFAEGFLKLGDMADEKHLSVLREDLAIQHTDHDV